MTPCGTALRVRIELVLASELDDIRSALEVNLGLGLGLVLAFQLGRTALEVNQRRGT